MWKTNRVLIIFVGLYPSSFDIGDLDAGMENLTRLWSGERGRILKDDWWVGFGVRIGGVKNKIINIQKDHYYLSKPGRERQKWRF